MARAMWRGAIQFGLVTVPVKLYLATESRGGLSFNLLHKECLNRIQMKTHCPIHGEIARSDTVRGFEYSKGQYVVIGEEDFDSVPLKTVRSIEIELFIEADRESQATSFVKQAYYLEPEAIGRKAFYLLKSVLADEGLSAICKIVLKDREALASINPYANTMLLSTLYWPDEVRSTAELDLPEEDFDFKPAEKQMAAQLVQAMRGDFEADQYVDNYRQALMAVIEAKVEGKPTEKIDIEEAPTKIADLMSVLEASVAAARDAKSKSASGGTTAATASTSAKAKKSEKVADIASGTKRTRTKAQATKAASAAPKEERRRKTA
ncbi:MAG TPA: Ku protein [Candidatus Limnocylindrales bacterium]|nr:Ku protein [Candidatus Limnocylindrales bacterium]